MDTILKFSLVLIRTKLKYGLCTCIEFIVCIQYRVVLEQKLTYLTSTRQEKSWRNVCVEQGENGMRL